MKCLKRIPKWYFTGAILPNVPLSLKYRRIIGVIKEFGRVLNERIAFLEEEEPATNRFDLMMREIDSSIGLIADITFQSTDGLHIDYAVRSGKPVLLIKESETRTSSMLTDWAKTPMPPPNLIIRKYRSNDTLENVVREFCKKAIEENPPLPGAYIVVEGGEGCGKSVQRELLGKYLREKGYSVVEKREPGGTRRGETIRKFCRILTLQSR